MVTARTDITIGPVASWKRSCVSRSRSGSQSPSARSQWSPRLEEIASLVAGQGEAAAGDAGFHDPTRVLRFFQEAQLQLPRKPQFASQEGQGPLKVASREALRKGVGLAVSPVARQKAALVSSAANPLAHIIAWP